MDVTTYALDAVRIENSVLKPYAARLQDYGYKPTTYRQGFYHDERGMVRSLSMAEFAAGPYRVVFLMSRCGYRIKIEDGRKLVFRSPWYLCSTRWERPFLYFFQDDKPIYPPRISWAEERAARRAEDKAAGLKPGNDEE